MAKFCYMNFVLVLFIASRSIASRQVMQGRAKLLVSVFYESLCPDSRAFVLRQLLPTAQLLDNYVTIQLVPFGSAESINDGYGGFRCHHGPKECLGNIVQDCVMNMMEGFDIDRVRYVACEMRTNAATKGNMRCIKQTGLNPKEVMQCASGVQGKTWQLDSEYLTNYANPSSIPAVRIDAVFDPKLDKWGLHDLTGALCKILADVPPCQDRFNNKMALRNILTSDNAVNSLETINETLTENNIVI